MSQKIDIHKYCEAAERIKENFGTEKALKYLIGEKFHAILKQIRFVLSQIKEIKSERKKPNYNPIRKVKHTRKTIEINLDEEYESLQEELISLNEAKTSFVEEIKRIFSDYETGVFLNSIMAFGSAEQFLSPEEYKFCLKKGMLEKTVVDEADDVLILEEMKELLLS